MEKCLMDKMLNWVIGVSTTLLLIMIFSDEPLMFFSMLTISIIVTILISFGCASFSKKNNYKYYKKTIILSSGIIGLLSFSIKLFENLHLVYSRHIVHPELMCFPIMLTLTNIGISISIQLINRRKKYINPETYGCEIADGVIEPSEVALKLCDIDNEIINMRHIRRVLFTSPSHYKNSDDPKESFSKVDVGTEIYKVYYKNDLAGYVMINADIMLCPMCRKLIINKSSISL